MLVLRGREQPAVGGHHPCADQVVDRQPVPAHHPADAAAQGETADADVGGVASGEGPAVRIECRGHPAPGRAAADPHEPALGVEDLDVVKMRQVDHHPAGVGAVAERTVPARAHRHRQVVTCGVSERGRDLVRPARPDHQRWVARRVKRPRRLVVAVIARSQGVADQNCRLWAHRSLLVRESVCSISGIRWVGPVRVGTWHSAS